MKSCVLLLVLYSSQAIMGYDWKEKARHMEQNLLEVRAICAAKHDIADSEFKALDAVNAQGRLPRTRREKCIMECFLTGSGIMAQGKFSRDGSDALADYLYEDDPESLHIAKNVGKRCEKAVEAMKIEDSCEVADVTLKCLRRELKHFDIKWFPHD